MLRTTRLSLIRHAPAENAGRLCGRTDVAADLSDGDTIAALRAAVGGADLRITSPALRCRQTASAIWPDRAAPACDERLLEQDFGEWEGQSLEALPDLPEMSGAALAEHAPPDGERFVDVIARLRAFLSDLAAETEDRHIVLIAHAGTARAMLSIALGAASAGLAFACDPLSLTELDRHGETYTIRRVNWRPAPGGR